MPAVDSCVSNVFRDLNFSDTSVSTVVRTYALGIIGTPILTGVDGTAYAGFNAYGTGGAKPYSFAAVGSYPTGITVDATTGAVSGTPSVNGTFASLGVRVTDAYGVTADLATFTLVIGVANSGAYGLLLAITQ